MKKLATQPIVRCAALIGLGFLLTSTGWLAWEYHLLELVSPRAADVMTMVVGYALQALGIGVFALLLRRKPDWEKPAVCAALILHALCLIPALLSRSLVGTLAAGFLGNVFCGVIAGCYLHALTAVEEPGKRASALGIGYAASILASWLLAAVGGGVLYDSPRVWLVCLGLTAAALALVQWGMGTRAEAPHPAAKANENEDGALRGLYLTVCAVVLLLGVVTNSGFAFSAADLGKGIRTEFSRLFYALGLILAGFVTDRDRRSGAIAALSTMILPFIMLALRGEPVSLAVFWALNYFAFGFYAVYRVIVFSDLAEKSGLLYLSGLGLLIGRLGDAAGEAICLSLSDATTALVFLAALLFVTAVFLFFRIYRPLYLPAETPQQSERERFFRFAVEHDLSSRERDMLRLLLEEKTNAEIAATLSISENTVKFHMRNLLQKTGCRNRNELVTAYFAL